MNKIIEYIKLKFKTNLMLEYMMKPIFFMTLLVYIGFMYFTFGQRRPIDIGIAFSISVGGLLLLAFISIYAMDFIKKLPSATVFYLGSVIAMLFIMFDSNRAKNSNLVAVFVIPLFFICLGYLIYRIVARHRHWIVWPVRVLFAATGLLIIMMFFWEGIVPVYENAFLTLKTNQTIQEVEATHEVVEGIYGNDDYLNKYVLDGFKSENISIGNFLSKWNKSREKQLGFNIFDVPLNGMYYMPEEEGEYPLVLIVHGNHEMTHDSENGYGYLGRYLASRGYVVVSVDENFLNFSTFDTQLLGQSLGSENDARAYVLLKHIDFLLDEGARENSPFYGMIDTENIALVGHSRGGEAVAIARYFNELNYLPNDFHKKFDEDFEIKSIVSIAPTDRQYKPANRNVMLNDVNYLLLQGMHDMDVSYMAGINQYERIEYKDTDRFKAAVSIYGANHGYFNESWHRSDNASLGGVLHNSAQLLDRQVQETIASQLVYYFLEASLKGKETYRDGFTNLRSFSDLPETLYQFQYYDGSCVDIVNYNEDPYLETGLNGSFVSSKGLSKWSEGSMKLDGKISDVYGTYLGWNNTGEYIIELEDTLKVSKNDYLYLTLGDDKKDNDELFDLKVRLEDIDGKTSEIYLSQFSMIQHRIDVNLAKLFFIEDVNNHELILQTYQIPIKWFIEEGINSEIKKISLVFEDGDNNLIFLKEVGIRYHD